MTDRDRGFYEDPVVYDILHSPATREDFLVLERLWKRHLAGKKSRGLWLEPACGSGRFLRVGAARGHRIVGFDRNRGMVAYARQRLARLGLARRARVFEASMQSFSPKMKPASVGFAFNTINTIRHLESDAAMLAHFAEISRVLVAGGLYVVGMSLSAYGEEEPSEDVWQGRRGRCRVHQLVQYLPPQPDGPRPRVELVLSHLTIERPRGTKHRDDRYGLRCYDRKQWRSLIRRSALDLLEVTSDTGEPLQDFDGSYFLYLLRKKP